MMKCAICDRDDKEMYTGGIPRCVDVSDCVSHRKTLRIFKEDDLSESPELIALESVNSFFKEYKSICMMQYADFVAIHLDNGGIMFLKELCEDTGGKIHFAE